MQSVPRCFRLCSKPFLISFSGLGWPASERVFLGGRREPIARDSRDCLADNSFGSIGLRGIDKVDTQIDRLSDNSDGAFLRARVVAQSKAAGAAATKADHAYFESGFPKCCVFH